MSIDMMEGLFFFGNIHPVDDGNNNRVDRNILTMQNLSCSCSLLQYNDGVSHAGIDIIHGNEIATDVPALQVDGLHDEQFLFA